MSSVRVTAAGAVLVAILIAFTSPARACDDRFIKKCEKQSEAAAAAEETVAPAAKRGSSKRVKLVASRQSKHSRFVKRVRAPRFVTRPARRSPGASEVARMSALLPQSVLARRFRGFIDPQPIAQNAFEALRKPHAVALDFDATAIAPVAETADPEAVAVNQAPIATVAVTTTPKQDKLAKPAAAPPAKPAVQMELASAESRPVVLADAGAAKPAMAIAAKPAAAPPAKPVAQMELAAAESRPVVLGDAGAAKPAMAIAAVAAPDVLAAPVIMTQSPAPAGGQPTSFSFHGLVLALCGALGAASALRFIVGA